MSVLASSRTTIRSSRNRLLPSTRHGTISRDVRRVGTLIYSISQRFHADSKLRLPRSEAVLFPNKTSGIAGDPGYYMAELEIYHQLHCLGMHTIGSRESHVDHCVERIRQGLMCNVDTSVLVWEWNPTFNETRVRLRVPHQCKDFSKIHEWTRDRLMASFDRYTHVPDDLPTPPIY
ncbi:hypothetical protein B0H11DRAFT_1965056 [Mycena galericulata]|nr:hypothetical protein B0H11DRAFT_1965056 [Mycena galericulata]